MMKRCTTLMGAVLLTGLALLLMTTMVSGQSGDDDELSWWTVNGGGAQSAGGDYTLAGTAGQPDVATLTGGDYILVAGFWSRTPGDRRIFLPLVLRDDV